MEKLQFLNRLFESVHLLFSFYFLLLFIRLFNLMWQAGTSNVLGILDTWHSLSKMDNVVCVALAGPLIG